MSKRGGERWCGLACAAEASAYPHQWPARSQNRIAGGAGRSITWGALAPGRMFDRARIESRNRTGVWGVPLSPLQRRASGCHQDSEQVWWPWEWHGLQSAAQLL